MYLRPRLSAWRRSAVEAGIRGAVLPKNEAKMSVGSATVSRPRGSPRTRTMRLELAMKDFNRPVSLSGLDVHATSRSSDPAHSSNRN
jgi:hypothetical protein